MSSYINHQWPPTQQFFGQASQTTQEFDYNAIPSGLAHPQGPTEQRTAFTFHSSHQSQPPTRSQSAMMPPNFHPQQSEGQRPAVTAHIGSINAPPVQLNTFQSAGYNSENSQTLDPYPPVYTSPQQIWQMPASLNFQDSTQNPLNFNGVPEVVSYNNPPPTTSNTSPHHHPLIVPQSPYPSAHIPESSSKRPREQNSEDIQDDDGDVDNADARDGNKNKLPACARCKTLKVKCEFFADGQPCKRCSTGNHGCFIPTRKKRRSPPKREDLLNEIKDQARTIQELMAKLESAGTGSHPRPVSAASEYPQSSTLESPILSPSQTDNVHSPVESDSRENKFIEDWISKAKQSLQEFDVFIGAGMPKCYIVQDEDSEDDWEYEYVNISGDGTEVEIAVQNPDGLEIASSMDYNLRHKTSTSSLNTCSTGAVVKSNIESTKPAILPNEEVPFGLFGKLSLQSRPLGDMSEPEDDETKPTGIASKNFFSSTPTPIADPRLASLRHAPQILLRKIITPQEAEKLFQIYFENMNLSVSLLDPVLYTPQKTCFRSPFLFTVICAISSRFYSGRPDLYATLMPYAQQAAGLALISGPKNVDMCSAYILMSLYPVPVKKLEDQRNWLYLGLAIRIATDLNLNLPNTAKPLNENHAREMLNRTRVWLNCFNLDRSTGSQFGKAPIISPSDYTANNCEDWWKASEYNMKNFDIHICAYNAELRVMGKFISRIYGNPDHPTGLRKDADFEAIAAETDEDLKQLQSKWAVTLAEADVTDPQGSFRTGLLKLAYPYARLIALSYGFQYAFGRNPSHENPFLMRCLDAAFDVVVPVLEDLCRPNQRIYLRHGPEAQSVFITFASAFLVKLLQPKFAPYLPLEKRQEIRQLVQQVVDLLGSDEIAIDDRHGPKLYSKFLRNLLAAPMAKIDDSVSSSPVRIGKPKCPPSDLAGSMPEPPSFDVQLTLLDHSPTLSTKSLSPPARPAALSFNNFAPSGGLDPFAPDYGISNSLAIYMGEGGCDMNIPSDFFNPPLPNYDDALLQSMQSFSSDPSCWRDLSLTSSQDGGDLTWSMLEQSLNVQFSHDSLLYEDQFMNGPPA